MFDLVLKMPLILNVIVPGILILPLAQSAITCPKSIIETLQQGVKYAQS